MNLNCQTNKEIKIIEGYESISFSIKDGNNIALSELSIMDSSIAESYLSLAENKDSEIIKKSLELIRNSKEIYFFNRLNVPNSMRGKGLGEKLLDSTLNYFKENNLFLINVANNYGEMGQENLIKFYEKNGMKLIHEEGLLIYHKELISLDLNSKVTKNKSILK